MTEEKRTIQNIELSENSLLSSNTQLFGNDNILTEKSGPKKVILRAPLLVSSGYGTHSRQVARWLFDQLDKRDDLEVFTEPLRWGICPWLVNTDDHNGLVGRVVQHAQKSDHYDVSIQLQLANEWNPFLANYNIGISAMVECDTCNPKWIDNINQMDLVVVPSEFIKKSVEVSGNVKTKIIVIPEAFTDECKDENYSNEELNDINSIVDLSSVTTDFNFLIFGQFTGNNPENDRKNIPHTLRILCDTFKDNEDVGVVIKTNFGRNSHMDKASTINALTKILLEVKKGPGPKFHLLHGNMSDKEVAALYRHPKIKALVSLTHGEGFCLPALSSGASGLPVIITDWSGHTDFMNLGKYIKIDYQLAPIHQTRVDNAIFFPNMKWAYPIEQDVKNKLMKFYKSPAIPQQWAKELANKLQKTYNFEQISNNYTEAFKDII